MKTKTKARYARLVATEPAPLAPEASGAGSAATDTKKTTKKTARKVPQSPPAAQD